MDQLVTNLISLLKANVFLFSGFIILGSFLLMQLTIPRVIYIAFTKKLTAPIVARSSHSQKVPSLGGVSFYITLMIFISIIGIVYKNSAGFNIIAAISILFMVGLKDDLINSSAKVKLYGQIGAALFIVFSPEFHISNFNGFLGIYELNPIVSTGIAFFFLIFIINSYNLIDGIDGLAAIIGIVVSTTFAFLFYFKHDHYFSLFSILTASVLVGFLRFNLTKGKMKIFMGDCGSLVVGLVLGILTLHYLSSPLAAPVHRVFFPENRILFVFAVLFVPIFDTIRIIVIRIANGRSPFEADRNHLHHALLDKGFSHLTSSLILGGINLLITLTFFYYSKILTYDVFTLIMLTMYFIFTLIFYFLSRENRTHKRQRT